MIHVRWRKPTTIDELKETVKDVVRTVPERMIRDVVANICKRCKACVLPDGDCFKYFLKYVEKQFWIIFHMLVLNFLQVSYFLSYVFILGGGWEKTYCSCEGSGLNTSESS